MKKFIKFAFVAAIAVVAGYNVYKSQSALNGMSEFALANVEALANDDESTDVGITCGANEGACWMQGGNMCFVGEYTYFDCMFVGVTYISCTSKC